jgi:LacI family transcriptional regulator
MCVCPDAVCCKNDQLAVGALSYVRSQGISVPEELKLSGFDGSFLGEAMFPQLTTIQIDFSSYAQDIFSSLVGLIQARRKTIRTVRPLSGIRPCRVIVRESTRVLL